VRASVVRNAKPKKVIPDRYFSQAVGRALDALELLKRTDRPLPLQELTARLGGAKASVFRLVRTLQAAGYVCRNDLGMYLLSPDVRALVPTQFVRPLIRAAEPCLKNLVREFRETASLAALFDNHIEVVAVVESPQMIRMGNTVGRIIPPHASSLGKSITAFQTEERRERLLRSYGIYQYTPHTITDELKLRAEFDRIRAQGYATEREESHLQGCCFGVPVLAEDGTAIAGISISMPVMRLNGTEQEARLLAALRKAAETISTDLRIGAAFADHKKTSTPPKPPRA
jgi:IclR family acetate operon transcriptional repressor